MDNYISHADFCYTRMMLFSWTCDSAPTCLSESNGEDFSNSVNNVDKDIDIIIVNCNDINDIDDHFIDPLREHLNKTPKSFIFFSNDKKAKLINHLNEHFARYGLVASTSYAEGELSTFYINNHEITSEKVLGFVEQALKLEKDWLIKQVKKTYHKYDSEKRLSSTPLKASGEFNASEILSDPSKYKWISILLAESINKIIQLERPKSFTIIAASLRGAVIAGAVWEILCFVSKPALYIIDHMGPKHALLDIPRDNKLDVNYCIYVGDFIIGGTEFKVVNSYCNYFGGNIKHAFVIGKYIDEDCIGNSVKLHSLVNLKSCIDNLSYTLG